jgi:hypothetical protein
LGNICFEIKRLKQRLGTIFISVLVQIMNMNTTMNNGCTESSQKHTNICAGGGEERIFILNTSIMKIMEQIVCYMLKVGHTGMHIADPQQHNVCGQLFPYRSGGGGFRLPHHWEGGQRQNKILSNIIIILSMYSNYRLSIFISNDFQYHHIYCCQTKQTCIHSYLSFKSCAFVPDDDP